jgi:lysophospholipase L1-like esterase
LTDRFAQIIRAPRQGPTSARRESKHLQVQTASRPRGTEHAATNPRPARASYVPVASGSSSDPRLPVRKKLFFAIVPLTILVLVGEAASRTWLYWFAGSEEYGKYALAEEFPTAIKYAPHHYLCYRLQPNYRRGATVHNSLGFRGDEIAIPKPAGVFRIAILGGSTTYTEFVPNNAATFPAQLQRILREDYGHDQVEVINAGCPGHNSWESLVNLEFRVLDLEPDLVIPYEGVNDVHARLVLPGAYRGDNSGRRQCWQAPWDVRLLRYSCLARIVGHQLGLWNHPGVDCYVQADTSDPGTHGYSRRIGGEPLEVLNQNPPVYFRRNLRNIIAVARANGANVLLATWAHSNECGDYAATPHYEEGFAENNDVVRQMAREQGAPLFDFATLMPKTRSYWRDGRHVNEAGARLQAAMFAKYLHENHLIGRR